MFIQTRGPLVACLLNDYVLQKMFVENLGAPGARGPGARAPLALQVLTQVGLLQTAQWMCYKVRCWPMSDYLLYDQHTGATNYLLSLISVDASGCSPAASNSGCFLTGSLSTRASLLCSTLTLFVVGAFSIVFFWFFSFFSCATFAVFLATAAFYAMTIIKCSYATLRPHHSSRSPSRISRQHRCHYIGGHPGIDNQQSFSIIQLNVVTRRQLLSRLADCRLIALIGRCFVQVTDWMGTCSHHSFGTGTVPERNRAPVFTPVPLRPVVPERADHLAMWSQWNGSGTGPVGSVVWTRNWTRSGTVPVARDIRRFPAHSSYLQKFITSWHLKITTDRLIGDKSKYSDWSVYLSWSNMRNNTRLP